MSRDIIKSCLKTIPPLIFMGVGTAFFIAIVLNGIQTQETRRKVDEMYQYYQSQIQREATPIIPDATYTLQPRR